MMNHSSKFLAVTLVSLFLGLLLLQEGLSLFFPVSHPSLTKQNNAPLTIITGGLGGVVAIPGPPTGNPVCHSGITSTPADMLKLLAPGWTINNLSEQYRTETRRILCYDHWNTAWDVPGGTWVNVVDFLKTMSWPSDLFDPSAGTQMLIVSGPDIFKQPDTNGANENPTKLTCSWQPNLGIVQPNIDLCVFGSVLLKAIVLTPLKGAVNAITGDTTNNTSSFFWTTPAKLTYANPDLGAFWNVSLYIVNALLVLSVAWVSLRYMMSIGSWLSYADLLELLPRLVLALMAAYLSVRICQIAIDGSNALGSAFNHTFITNLEPDPQDLFTLFCQIMMCVLILLLILEEVVRYAILFVLIGFGPIWAFSGALKETQFIFKGALRALFFVSLLQPAQIAVLNLGQQLTKNLGGNANSPLYYLVSIALMLFVLFMMSWFLRAGGITMPYGWTGVAGLAIGTQGITRGIGWTIRSAGRAGRRLATPQGGAVAGGAAGGGSGSNGGGGSNNRWSNQRGSNNRSSNDNRNFNEDGTRRRKARRLPSYVRNSRRVQQLQQQVNP